MTLVPYARGKGWTASAFRLEKQQVKEKERAHEGGDGALKVMLCKSFVAKVMLSPALMLLSQGCGPRECGRGPPCAFYTQSVYCLSINVPVCQP